MENLERAYSESVENKFQEMMKKYEIPDYMEFQLKTWLSLQEEYNRVTKVESDHTKKRENLLSMISRSQLPYNVFKEREKEIQNKTKIYIVCKSGEHTQDVFRLIHSLIDKKKIIRLIDGFHLSVIVTTEYEIEIEKFSEVVLQGKQCDMYFNLTGDTVVEDILSKVFRK